MDDRQRNRVLVAAAVGGVGFAVVAAWRDYSLYLSYGPGGLPYNAVGWLATNLLGLLSVNPFTAPVAQQGSRSSNSFLRDTLAMRHGSRPRIGRHPVPQRQLEQIPSPEMRQKTEERFDDLAYALCLRDIVEVKQSGLERHYKAMFVSSRQTLNEVAALSNGEICHIHRGVDGSIHVVLSAADCKQVIDQGWGQRHLLSGVATLKRLVGLSLPVHYTLLYAPRNDTEIATVMEIIKASVRFLTKREDV